MITIVTSIFVLLSIVGVYFYIKRLWKKQEELKDIKNSVKEALNVKKEIDSHRNDTNDELDKQLSKYDSPQ